jgi:hypothetical protein
MKKFQAASSNTLSETGLQEKRGIQSLPVQAATVSEN